MADQQKPTSDDEVVASSALLDDEITSVMILMLRIRRYADVHTDMSPRQIEMVNCLNGCLSDLEALSISAFNVLRHKPEPECHE